MAPAPLSLSQRLGAALRVLRGRPEDQRAIVPLTYPNFPGLAIEPQTPKDGTAQLSLVRTANPQEYKPDGAFIRTEGFGRHPVVHACIRVISDLVASVPLVVLREKGDYESRVGESHPLQRLLDYPAPRVSARTLRARMAVDFLGYGNAIAEIERDSPQGLPRRIKPINPESLQSVWVDTEGDARRYDYANWAGVIVYRDVADILHVRDIEMPRPFQPDVFGFPRGAAALASIAADNEATKYVRQVVTNDGTPTFAVLLADEATQDDASAMQDRYRARVVDRGKRGTPAFFGAVRDIKPLGFTLSDLEFPDLRRVSREDICAVFGVDPRMIGIASATSDAGLSGSQYVEARARLVQHTVEPLMAAIEDELNHWLAPEFGNVWISYDHDILRDLVENDETTSTRIRAEFAASLRTWEESRRALKLSPLPEPTDTILMGAAAKLVPAAVAVIDPSQVLEQAPATDDEPVPIATSDPTQLLALPGTPAVKNLQGTALNGAQITAMIDLLQQVSANALPIETAQALLLAGFPGVSTQLIEQMLAGVSDFVPPTPASQSNETQNEDEDEDGMGRADSPKYVPADQLPSPNPLPPLEDAEGRPYWVHHPEVLDKGPRREEDSDILFRYWKRATEFQDVMIPRFESTALALFTAQRRDVGKMFAAAEGRAVRAEDPILAEIERRIRVNYAPGGDYHAAWREAYLDLIETMYLSGAKMVAGTGFSFGLKTPEVMAAIEARAAQLATYVGETTAQQATAAVLAGERAGLSVQEIGRLIARSVYGPEMTKVRADRIARTEVAGAQSQGSWDQAQAEGDLFRSKEWLAFTDGKTRPSHLAAMDAGRIAMDAVFPNGLRYSSDPRGRARDVVNCRCTMAYFTEPVEGVA